MTEEEKQEIITAVLTELTNNSEAASEVDVATSISEVEKLSGIDEDGQFIMLPANMLSAHVTLTQEEYDALVDSGTIDEDTYYYIEEEA